VVHNLSLVIWSPASHGRGVRLEDWCRKKLRLSRPSSTSTGEGKRFSTYAVWWIRAYITRCLKDGLRGPPDHAERGCLRGHLVEETWDRRRQRCHAPRSAGDEGRARCPAPACRAEEEFAMRWRVSASGWRAAWDILSDRLTQDDPRRWRTWASSGALARARPAGGEEHAQLPQPLLSEFDEAA